MLLIVLICMHYHLHNHSLLLFHLLRDTANDLLEFGGIFSIFELNSEALPFKIYFSLYSLGGQGPQFPVLIFVHEVLHFGVGNGVAFVDDEVGLVISDDQVKC